MIALRRVERSDLSFEFNPHLLTFIAQVLL